MVYPILILEKLRLLQMKTKSLPLICLLFSLLVSCNKDLPNNNEALSLENVIGMYFNARFDIVCGNQELYWNNYEKEVTMFSNVNKALANFPQEERVKFYIMTFHFDLYLDTESLGEWGNFVVCNGDLEELKRYAKNLVLRLNENSNNHLIKRYQEMLLFLNTIKECDMEN